MILRFATCELDCDRQSLRRDGEQVAVEPQVFDLIRLLAENPDRLVTRDEIVDVVWQGRIVSEGAISARIAAARKALGDTGSEQKVIRTVQRRGLQMAVPVRRDIATVQDTPAAPITQTRPASRLRYTQGPSGARLGYMLQGHGPPVMRIDAPGWNIELEQTSDVWRDTANWLDQHCRQLRYSICWADTPQATTPRIDFDLMAEDIRTVADTAGFGEFALITESGGIHAGLRFAARYPERVTRMVIHGGYVEGRSRRSGTLSDEDVFRHMIAQGWQADTTQIGASFMLPYFPEGPLAAILEGAQIFQSAVPRDTELALRDAINEVDNSALLPLIKCPVLVVHGRADGVHPVTEARRIVEGIADAELWIMETANSLPVSGHPLWESYKVGLLEFLLHGDKV